MNIQQSKRPGPPTALRRVPPSCAEGGKSFLVAECPVRIFWVSCRGCTPDPRFWCTFPRGLLGHRLYSHISRHLPPLPPGKVPRFPAILVHFPPWLAGAPALQPSLAAPAVSSLGESAGDFRDFGALSPARHETSGEVQQGVLGEVLSIQVL